MIFHTTKLAGAYLIEPERLADERGFFARMWCQREFESHGLNANLVQCSNSFNHRRGTLRGMHLQVAPYEETKLVRATRGAIYDVIVDLRSDSPTYCQWFGAELTADNELMLYIPEGFAHGFQTLTDAAEVFYQISDFYRPEAAAGVRWNDLAFAIDWPLKPTIMASRDAQYPDYQP